MLNCIHESHKGIVKCKQRARDILFWPGMSSQVEDKVSKFFHMQPIPEGTTQRTNGDSRATRQTMG